MDIKIENITREELVDLFTTATYGSSWLGIKTLKNERHLDEQYSPEYLEERCIEEKWADRLLAGGSIVCIDYDDEDEDGKPVRYVLNLDDIKKGLTKAAMGEAVRDWADFCDENDDYFTCNNLMQVCIFGEVIYG
jgi:hypothetical protein